MSSVDRLAGYVLAAAACTSGCGSTGAGTQSSGDASSSDATFSGGDGLDAGSGPDVGSGSDAGPRVNADSGADAGSGLNASSDAGSGLNEGLDAGSGLSASSDAGDDASRDAAADADAASSCSGAPGLTASGGIPTTATVNFGLMKSAMSPQGLGVDTAVYDGILISSTVATTLKAAGIQALRYPGGSYADIFNWQTTTVNDGAYVDTNDSFANFMNTVVNPAGAKAIITVNYGSNPTNDGPANPSEAAAWVTYANITNKWGITYWEIGNENVGNGYYATEDWEYDLHDLDQTAADRVGQSVLSPLAYGTNSVAFINAMKAVDPTIKCGVYQLAPDVYPNTANPPYNAQVLQGAGSVIDFVIIHWYPCGTDAATCLQAPLQIPAIVSGTQSELAAAVPSRANQIELLITESGAGSVTGPATALFAADDYLSWFENGAVNVEYQELHNGFLTSGDTGIADNSPEGPYYGAKMSGILAAAGDTFVTATSSSAMIGVHAVKKVNGTYGVMLVNRDPSNAYTVTVAVSNATFNNCGTRYDFGQANFNGTFPSSGVTPSTVSGFEASSFTITVPAYTVSIVTNPG
jgi:hypothetical protein